MTQTIEIKKEFHFSTEELINAVSYLDAAALNALLERIQKILHGYNYLHPNEREIQLLEAIQSIMPPAVLRRFRQLRQKQENGTLLKKEQEEIQLLADILEEESAERVMLLGELAKLRNMTLPELRKQFRLQEFYA